MNSITTEKIRENAHLEIEDDKLGYYNLAKSLLGYIESKEFPLSVGVYGKWGSGKTVLANYMKKIKTNEINFIDFDAIEFRDSGKEIFWFLIGKIYDTLFGTNTETLKSLLGSVEGISNTLKEIDGTIGNICKGTKAFIDFFKKEKLAKKVFELINNEIRNKGEKYIIQIDNLDRLNPKETIMFLEQMKFFLLKDAQGHFENFAYLLLCDFDVLQKEIYDSYGDSINVRDYLNKLIEVPFQLPAMQKDINNNFIQSLLNPKLGEELIKLIKTAIDNVGVETPRDIKNYLLEVDMSFIIAKSKGKDKEFLEHLTKILTLKMIQAKHQDIYNFIRSRKAENYSARLHFAVEAYKYINKAPDSIHTKSFQEAVASVEDTSLKRFYERIAEVYDLLTSQKIIEQKNGNGFYTKDMNFIIESVENTPDLESVTGERKHSGVAEKIKAPIPITADRIKQ
jgi:predicted KAP-like P-loop ATPase